MNNPSKEQDSVSVVAWMFIHLLLVKGKLYEDKSSDEICIIWNKYNLVPTEESNSRNDYFNR